MHLCGSVTFTTVPDRMAVELSPSVLMSFGVTFKGSSLQSGEAKTGLLCTALPAIEKNYYNPSKAEIS